MNDIFFFFVHLARNHCLFSSELQLMSSARRGGCHPGVGIDRDRRSWLFAERASVVGRPFCREPITSPEKVVHLLTHGRWAMVSDVWKFCTRVSTNHVQCNLCFRIMVYHGTTNLRVHVGRHFGLRPFIDGGRTIKAFIKRNSTLCTKLTVQSVEIQGLFAIVVKNELDFL